MVNFILRHKYRKYLFDDNNRCSEFSFLVTGNL